MLYSSRLRSRIFSALLAPLTLLAVAPALADDTWDVLAPMSYARFGHAAGVINGTLYVVGGNGRGNERHAVLEAYDPTNNSWSTLTSMSTVRGNLAAGVANGLLFAIGGNNNRGFVLATVEAYDPATNTWTTRTGMPTARHSFGVGVVDGVLYAVGGYGSSGILNSVEAYDPVSNTWTTKTPMPTPRHSLAVGVADGILYAVGGNNGTTLATVEAYDPVTDTWTARAAMPTARESLAVGVVNDILYAIGGYNGGVLATVEAYDPSTDTWSPRTSMPTARYSFATGVVSPLIFAVGGNTSSCCYNLVTVLEAYTAPSAPPNLPPTAVPGPDQPVHVGQTVVLNGGDSFDDNTPAALLEYAWTFESKPAGSLATLLNADTATPSFVVDVIGTYSVQLIVTDEAGLSSPAAYVTVSSENLAPTAHAGSEQAAVVGQMVTLDGTGSTDPDGDALTYTWSFVAKPLGSLAELAGTTTAAPTFTPDVAGEYAVGLVVSDGYADSAPADVIVSVITAADYAQSRLADALNYLRTLAPEQFKARGLKRAFALLLTRAITALQRGDLAEAKAIVEAALRRTDGYPTHGAVDVTGPGVDWIVDPAAQAVIHQALTDAINVLPDTCHRHAPGGKHHGGKHHHGGGKHHDGKHHGDKRHRGKHDKHHEDSRHHGDDRDGRRTDSSRGGRHH
jgi:N-acetylneuraminic acid mutarotase